MNFAPQLTHQHEIHLGFRFGVHFFTDKGPNKVDIRFQKVSGLGASIETDAIQEGGQNFYTQKLPTRVQYETLKLERGMLVGSSLSTDFYNAMRNLEFAPANVMIMLLNELAQPVTGWLFTHAFPIKWSTSDLDASEPRILIDSLELAYSHIMKVEM